MGTVWHEGKRTGNSEWKGMRKDGRQRIKVLREDINPTVLVVLILSQISVLDDR